MKPAGLRPASELFADRPHGTRHRYLAGCRCLPCRSANSEYSIACERRKRRGEGNPIIDAGDVVRHVLALSRRGIGYKTVADAARASHTTLAKLLRGERTRLRRDTAQRILAVDTEARAPHALVPVDRTRARIKKLLDEGFTKTRIARELGSTSKTPSVQFLSRPMVTRETELKVERLARRYLLEGGDDA